MSVCPICKADVSDIYVHLDASLLSGCTQHEGAVRDLFAAVDDSLAADRDIYEIRNSLSTMHPDIVFLATDSVLHYRKMFLKEKTFGVVSEWDMNAIAHAIWKGLTYKATIAAKSRELEDPDGSVIAGYILDRLSQGHHPTCHVCGREDGKPYNFGNTFLPSDCAYVCDSCLSLLKGPKVSVTRQFYFAAAHYLPEYVGKCANLHGHEWKVELSFERAVNLDTHMVIDYTLIKQLETDSIDAMFDHSKVNLLLARPTAENILLFTWERLMLDFGAKNLSRIRVWESINSYADLTSSSMAAYILNS